MNLDWQHEYEIGLEMMAAETRNTETDRCLTVEIASVFRTHPGGRKINRLSERLEEVRAIIDLRFQTQDSYCPNFQYVLISADDAEQQRKYDTSSRWVTASAFLTRKRTDYGVLHENG